MDRILLHGIRCTMRVGVSLEERRRSQECLVDVEMGQDLTRATQSDDLNDTLDYGRIYDLVQLLARSETFALLERFVGRLEEELRQSFDFKSITIRAKKVKPPLAGSVDYAGVEIHR